MSNRPTDVFGPASRWMAAFAAEDAEREAETKEDLINLIMEALLLFDQLQPNILVTQVANSIRNSHRGFANEHLADILQDLQDQSEDAADMNDPAMTAYVDFLLPREKNHSEQFL